MPQGIDPRGLADEALMCAADDLVTAGGIFSRRTAEIRSCPWLPVTPRLHTISEATERLRQWAEASWERLGLNRGRGTFDDKGQFAAIPLPNPFASKQTGGCLTVCRESSRDRQHLLPGRLGDPTRQPRTTGHHAQAGGQCQLRYSGCTGRASRTSATLDSDPVSAHTAACQSCAARRHRGKGEDRCALARTR